jgi:hypothetical protein
MHAVPPGPPGPYQLPPAPGTPGPGGPGAIGADRRVSPAGYWIAGAVLLVGAGAAVVWFVIAIVSLVNIADDFDRIAVPGRGELTLDEGDWVIYHEHDGASSGTFVPEPTVSITGPDGDTVPLMGYLSSSTDNYVTTSGNEGVAIGGFIADEPGRYQVAVAGESSPPQRVAVGRAISDSIEVTGILGSMALGAFSVVVALVVFIVTVVRRGRAKRARFAAAYGYAGEQGHDQPWGSPAAGWGPPPAPPGAHPGAPTGWGPPPPPPPPTGTGTPPANPGTSAPWSPPDETPPRRTPPPPGTSPWARPGDDRSSER